jgi:hypothetical protein
MPPNQICKQSWVTYLSLYKHCFHPGSTIGVGSRLGHGRFRNVPASLPNVRLWHDQTSINTIVMRNVIALSVAMLNVTFSCCYSERWCTGAIMLLVAMLLVVMLSVAMLSVTMLKVIMQSVIFCYCYAECGYAEYHHDECYFAECCIFLLLCCK